MTHDPPQQETPQAFEDDTPVCVHAIAQAMQTLMGRIVKLAAHEAKHAPSPTGVYAIALIVDDQGRVLSDKNGAPLVVRAPVDVRAIEPGRRKVHFSQPNQLVKRSEAARIAGTSVSTIKRAEASGELRAVKVSERDTSYWMADLNALMFKRLLSQGPK